MTPLDLQKLLELTVHEQNELLEAHQRRVQFYSSLVSAVLAATIAGAISATLPIHYWLLLIGPFLVIMLSKTALGGTLRLYQRFLEAITVRAKVEQMLQFHHPLPQTDPPLWPGEPLLPTRHLQTRHASPSSEAFIVSHRQAGYQKHTRQLFFLFGVAALFLGLILVYAALNPPTSATHAKPVPSARGAALHLPLL